MAEAGEPDINKILIRHLQDKNEIILASGVFAAQKTNERRVQLCYELLQENDILPILALDGKSDDRSRQFRQQGNDKFRLKKSREAVELYSKSIAYACTSEIVSLGYANRSAVLFEHGLYRECIIDIQRALDNNYPDNLKHKLQSRLDNARKRLPNSESIKFATSVPTTTPNSLIQSACGNVEIRTTAALGRHVVATCDILPGDVIAVEKAYSHVLLEQHYIHCHHCVNLCYNLIPCAGCTQALFCSDTCLNQSMKYHQYECPIIPSIKKMDLTCRWVHLRTAILACQEPKVEDTDGVYRSDRYKEIHNLVSNTDKRTVADLFNRAVHSASFYHLLKTSSKFFDSYSEDLFKEMVLLHMQTGPCNFHELTEDKSCDKSIEKQEIGAGAFSFLSMFNHSCIPNVIRYSFGTTVVAVAIEKIKKGEQCFDNYGYHHAVMCKKDRQLKLKNQYFFDCTCTACLNDYPLYDSLKVIDNKKYRIPLEDLEFLEKRNLKETNRIYKEVCSKIEELQEWKPNRNLSEMQEALKQCFFNFETVLTPF